MSRRPLSEEERVLWSQVTRTARPLKGRLSVEAETETQRSQPRPAESAGSPIAALPAAPPPAKKRQHVGRQLDEPTLERLARGRTPIEGRVDLHGLTQAEAHELLYSFLLGAHARGIRYVLVITGKGNSSGGDGVLKRMVPAWLATPAFRLLVSTHDHAARQHGGSGALYVRLRRTRT